MLVIVGAVAIIGFSAATFSGHTEFGSFADAGGIDKYIGGTVSVMFAIDLIDAALIGASAVSLSTAYALGEIESANVEGADRAEVTAKIASHKRREIALEYVVAKLAGESGVTRARWSSQTQSV